MEAQEDWKESRIRYLPTMLPTVQPHSGFKTSMLILKLA